MGFRVEGAENCYQQALISRVPSIWIHGDGVPFVYDSRCPVRDVYCDEQGRYILLESPSDPTTCVILNWDLEYGLNACLVHAPSWSK